MKRKLSSLFLMMILVFSSFPFTSFANEVYPTYQSLSVSPKEAAINETVWFDLYAPDSAYFMLEARLTYRSPQGETRVIELSGPDHWTSHFTATSIEEVGTWELQSIYLYDDSYNSSTFTRDQIEQPENYDFTILNEVKNPDVTAPVIDGITFDKEEVEAGGFTKVTVAASDESGIESESINLALYNTSARGYEYVSNFVKSGEGTYEATWWVPPYSDPGEWRVNWITASDRLGNQYYWDTFIGEGYPDSFGTIQVKNDNPDFTAPTVSSIQFDNGVVEAGQENTITINAEDDLSGINYLSVELRNSFNQRFFIDGIYPNENGSYATSFTVPSYMKSSTFKVWSVYTQDNAGNVDHQFYEDEYPSEFGTFQVINNNEDVQAPVIESLTFEKEIMSSNDINVVKVNAADDNSGIESIDVYMTGPNGKFITNANLYQDEDGNFKGEFSVPPYTDPGEWRVKQIIAKDYAGNAADIQYTTEDYPELFGTFIVEADHYDQTPPTVNKVVFSPSEVKGNEEAVATIYASDNETVPGVVEVELVSPSGQQVLKEKSEYLDEDGLMHATFSIPSNAEHGEWLIKSVKIVDVAGNKAVYTYNADTYPEFLDRLFVNNDTTAPSAPVVEEVSDKDLEVRGTAEPFATVSVKTNGNTLIETETSEDGTFTVEIPNQKAGTMLEITARDAAGNVSDVTKVIVTDRTAPDAPVVSVVTKEHVAGTAEASSTIYVKDSQGTVIASAKADANGNFLIKLEKQKNHTILFVNAVDDAGNESDKVEINVKDARL